MKVEEKIEKGLVGMPEGAACGDAGMHTAMQDQDTRQPRNEGANCPRPTGTNRCGGRSSAYRQSSRRRYHVEVMRQNGAAIQARAHGGRRRRSGAERSAHRQRTLRRSTITQSHEMRTLDTKRTQNGRTSEHTHRTSTHVL